VLSQFVSEWAQGQSLGEASVKLLDQLNREYEEVEREFVSKTALRHMVTADDVAELVAFLASPAANNITGQAIDVSAGYGL